jgi:hypothetical protein
MAVVLADLDIGHRLDLHKFEKGGKRSQIFGFDKLKICS